MVRDDSDYESNGFADFARNGFRRYFSSFCYFIGFYDRWYVCNNSWYARLYSFTVIFGEKIELFVNSSLSRRGGFKLHSTVYRYSGGLFCMI